MARLAALIVVVVLFPAAAAQATTYCVNTTGSDCDVPEGSSFQQALDDAKNHTGPDAIRLGSAALTTPSGFTYNTPVQGNTVAIIGAGGRAFGQSRTSMS